MMKGAVGALLQAVVETHPFRHHPSLPSRCPGPQAALTYAEPLPAGLPLLVHLLPLGHHLSQFHADLRGGGGEHLRLRERSLSEAVRREALQRMLGLVT